MCIIFKPIEIGEFDYQVAITNQSDPNNVETVWLNCRVSNEPKPHTNSVLAPDKLHFGDCYSGSRIFQLLTIRNVTEEQLDIQFGSSLPNELAFEVHTEKYDEEKEDHASDSDDENLSNWKKEKDFMDSPISPVKNLTILTHFS